MVAQFHQVVFSQKTHPKIMEQEVRMSMLKVRPHAGDVFHLNMGNKQFIDVLWKVLKWEHFMEQGEKILSKNEFVVYQRLMGKYRETLQDQINRVDIRLPHLKSKGVDVPVALEIFRDFNRKNLQRRKLH